MIYCQKSREVRSVARSGEKKKKSKKRRGELLPGLGAVAAAMVVLAALFFSLPEPSGPAETVPAVTAPSVAEPGANIYGPEDFAMDGDYLTCIAGESVLGIDVSSHQQTVDWDQVAQAGVKFAMIRLGYRGYESGAVVQDSYALDNLRGAREAGLMVGAYFYSQAVSVEEALEEARFCLELLDGQYLDFPLVFDWEYVSESARTGSFNSRTLTDCTIAFCEAVKAAGYAPMVYFNTHLAREGFLLEELTAYDFWLAMYDTPMEFPYRVQMWQYTQSGTVPGIDAPVDINLYLP